MTKKNFDSLKELDPKVDQRTKEDILFEVKRNAFEENFNKKVFSLRFFLKKTGLMFVTSLIIAIGLIFRSSFFEKKNDKNISTGKYIIYAEEGGRVNRNGVGGFSAENSVTKDGSENLSTLAIGKTNFIDSGKYIFEYNEKYEFVGDKSDFDRKNDGKMIKVTFDKMSEKEILAFAKKFGFSEKDKQNCDFDYGIKEPQILTKEVKPVEKEVLISSEEAISGNSSSFENDEVISETTNNDEKMIVPVGNDWCKKNPTFTKVSKEENFSKFLNFYSWDENRTNVSYHESTYAPIEYDPNFIYPDYRLAYEKAIEKDKFDEEKAKEDILKFIKENKLIDEKFLNELKFHENIYYDMICPVGEWVYYETLENIELADAQDLYRKSPEPKKCQKEISYEEGKVIDYNQKPEFTKNLPRVNLASFNLILRDDNSDWGSSQIMSFGIKYNGQVSSFFVSPVLNIEKIDLNVENAGKMFELLQKGKTKPVWNYGNYGPITTYKGNMSGLAKSSTGETEEELKKETIKITNTVKVNKIENTFEIVYNENEMYLIPSYNLIGKMFNGKNPIEEKVKINPENKEVCEKYIEYNKNVSDYWIKFYDADKTNDIKLSTPEGLAMITNEWGSYPDYNVYNQYMCYVFEEWYKNQPESYEYFVAIPAISDLEIRLKK